MVLIQQHQDIKTTHCQGAGMQTHAQHLSTARTQHTSSARTARTKSYPSTFNLWDERMSCLSCNAGLRIRKSLIPHPPFLVSSAICIVKFLSQAHESVFRLFKPIHQDALLAPAVVPSLVCICAYLNLTDAGQTSHHAPAMHIAPFEHSNA